MKIPVAVLGATGSVGQRFVGLLAAHPWFEIRRLAASERSVGKPYAEAVDWMQSTPLPPSVAEIKLARATPEEADGCPLVFSSLDAGVAGAAESAFARAGAVVVSNAKSHRMSRNVPLLVPEVNADHLELAERQDHPGMILTNPNCSTIGLVLALKPLVDAFGVEAVSVVTMQALSGAGLPGVPGMRAVDNVVPFIAGEEEKIESESPKILGRFRRDRIEPADVSVSAHCNRVAVIDGHTQCVSVKLRRPARAEDVRKAWIEFTGEPQELGLPSAPVPPIHWLPEADAPQPRLHRNLGAGMAISVGRLRSCPLLDYRFVTLSHNTVRGAAGGALLVAELAVEKGCLTERYAGTRSRG
jgi:aspartate-semialdehyde dehydrogenase